MMKIFCVIFTLLNTGVYSIEFTFGDCPVIINEPCAPERLKFLLHTRSGSKINTYKLNPFKPVLPPEFKKTVPLKIIIHGYGGISVDSATTNVTKAYQDIGYNVIFVDWEFLGFIPCFPSAYVNSWHVGQCVAVLATGLATLGITPDKLHIIGFSLGAHIAGFAGTHVRRTLGVPFARITGLDPALPFFATLKNTWKLDPEDATFVDVVHTSAGFFGKIEPTGHVDFYMNGGSLQPACYKRRYPPVCSHIMAGLYFAESIYNTGKPFIGRECRSINDFISGTCSSTKTATMGEFISPRTAGVFFVETSDKAPFALGIMGLLKKYLTNYVIIETII